MSWSCSRGKGRGDLIVDPIQRSSRAAHAAGHAASAPSASVLFRKWCELKLGGPTRSTRNVLQRTKECQYDSGIPSNPYAISNRSDLKSHEQEATNSPARTPLQAA